MDSNGKAGGVWGAGMEKATGCRLAKGWDSWAMWALQNGKLAPSQGRVAARARKKVELKVGPEKSRSVGTAAIWERSQVRKRGA